MIHHHNSYPEKGVSDSLRNLWLYRHKTLQIIPAQLLQIGYHRLSRGGFRGSVWGVVHPGFKNDRTKYIVGIFNNTKYYSQRFVRLISLNWLFQRFAAPSQTSFLSRPCVSPIGTRNAI